MKKYLTFAVIVSLFSCGEGSDSDSGSAGGSGTGGSLAKFTIAKDNLYVMDFSKVVGFSLEQPTNPQQIDAMFVSDGETLFNYQNTHLMAGKQSGVEIIELSESGAMTTIAEHSHITSCDPVVAEGNLAYLTTRSGNNCWFGVNSLEVLDITDLSAPVSVSQKDLPAPNGLAVSGNDLFVCDLFLGLQRFTIEESEEIVLVASAPSEQEVVNEGLKDVVAESSTDQSEVLQEKVASDIETDASTEPPMLIEVTRKVVDLKPGYINDVYACNDIIIKGDLLILSQNTGITQIRWHGDEFEVLSELVQQ